MRNAVFRGAFCFILLLCSALSAVHKNDGSGALNNNTNIRLCHIEVIQGDTLLEIISRTCHIRYTWILPPHNLKKSWLDWLVDTVSNQEADMIPVPMFMNYERAKKFDFLHPFAFVPISFAIQSPKRVQRWTAIFSPFTYSVWISIIITTIITAIFLYLLLRTKSSKLGGQPSFPIVFWFVASTLTNQSGIERCVRGLSSLFLIGIWILSSTVIVNAYACTLISHLISPEYSYVPQDFIQLSEEVSNGRYTVGSMRGSAVITLLSDSKEKRDIIILEGIKKSPLNTPDSVAGGMTRVMSSNHAFVFSLSDLQLFGSLLGDSNFFYSEDVLCTFASSYGVRKGFPLKRRLNKIISRIFESGILQKDERFTEHTSKWFNGVKEEEGIQSLDIVDMQGPFILLCCGYILSSVILCLEIMFKTSKECITGRAIRS